MIKNIINNFIPIISDMYVHDVETKMTAINKEPITVKETSATALVDGNNVLGPVVGNYSMDLAIQKARTAGIGFVVAKGKKILEIVRLPNVKRCVCRGATSKWFLDDFSDTHF